MQANTVHQLPIDKVVGRPQVRRDFDDVRLLELAESIRQVGVQQPIQVYAEGEQFVILVGERRWRAAKRAGLSAVPAIVVAKPATDSATVQTQLIENLQRADLTPREKTAGIERLLAEPNTTAAQVAARLGLSPATVAKLRALPGLPQPILDAVDAGTISLSGAYELSQVSDAGEQQALAAKMMAGDLTRDGLVAARKASKRTKSATPVTAQARLTVALDGGYTLTIAGGVINTLDDLNARLDELRGHVRRALQQALSLDTFIQVRKDQAHV